VLPFPNKNEFWKEWLAAGSHVHKRDFVYQIRSMYTETL